MTARLQAVDEQELGFRVVPGPFYTPVQLSLAHRYGRVEDAVAAMGEGMVVAGRGGRLVAFHEKHLAVVERRSASAAGR